MVQKKMPTRLVRARGYSFLLCGLIYIIYSLAGWGNVFLPAAASALALAQCLPALSGSTRYVGIFLFGAGSLLLATGGADSHTWLKAVTQNGKILTLMLFVPLLSIPFNYPRHRRSLEYILRNAASKGTSGIYMLTHSMAHLVGVVVNIACVPITYYILKGGVSSQYMPSVARAAARGYATTCFWSPNSAGVGLVLASWGGSLLSLIPLGVPLAALAMALGWAENKYLRRDAVGPGKLSDPETACITASAGALPAALTSKPGTKSPEIENTIEDVEDVSDVEDVGDVGDVGDVKDSKAVYRDFYLLALAVSLLLGAVILWDWLTNLDILVIVPLMSLFYPFFWAILAGEQKRQLLSFKEFINGGLPRMSNEVVIFLGAGFFAVAVGASDLGHYLPGFFAGISSSPSLLAAVIILMIISFSLIGFHPILTLTVIVASLNPGTLGLPVVPMSAMALAGLGLAVACSPFSACSLSISYLTGKNPVTVSVRWQLPYVLLLFAATITYFKIVIELFY